MRASAEVATAANEEIFSFVRGPRSGQGRQCQKSGYVSTEMIANLKDFVFKGPFGDRGMPDFTGKLTEEDVVKIRAFIQGTADAIRPKK
jgi:quinohemoprotein ethanol dehydrogenase